MKDNPIVVWYQKDKQLSDLLVSIDEQQLSEEESGREAFYQVSALYKLPKFPEDIVAVEEDDLQAEEYDEKDEEEPRSVFEEIALARFLFPEDEYRGIVMFALHNIYHKSYIPYDEVAAQFFGNHADIPDNYFLYFFGKDVAATVKLDIGEQSWVEAGVRFMMKIIKMS